MANLGKNGIPDKSPVFFIDSEIFEVKLGYPTMKVKILCIG